MLPPEIPLFPLPNLVLFPGAVVPLHIFEPRYRAMVADALDGERLIGMVLLRPGWEREYEGTPGVYPVGCAGFIAHSSRQSDGRYNILLRGLEKFRIVQERCEREGAEMYRVGRIEAIPEAVGDRTAAEIREARKHLEQLIAKRLHRSAEEAIPKGIADEDFINGLAQHFEPLERQALLECDGVLRRCRTIIELLEMKMIGVQPVGKTRH
jgi:Lon protease-like protein